jgi:hypothetical protein
MLLKQIVLFARSTLAVLFLAIFISYWVVVQVFSIRRFLCAIGVASVLVLAVTAVAQSGALPLEDVRIYKVFLILLQSPELLLLVDASVNDRFFHIVFSLLGSVENYLLPNGFSAWFDYLDHVIPRFSPYAWWVSDTRVMSAYGGALFELGGVGLLIPFVVTLLLYRYFEGDKKAFVVAALCIHTVMMTGTPLALPLFPFLIGYLAYRVQFDQAPAPHPAVS